jgi:Mg/Co/Ni transporter MgtE
MGKQNYIIDDLEEFTRSARKLVFNGFNKSMGDDPDEFTKLITDITPEDLEEMNQILTQQESLIIVKNLAKEQKHKITNESRYLIDEKIFSQIIEEMNGRLVSNMLSSLASKGMIESAYDDDINDFVFWIKDNESPETD